MSNQDYSSGLFFRWLWLVYLPLGALGLLVILLAFGELSGRWWWLTALLAVYCVIPARLLVETKRKGLEFPKPPARSSRSAPAARGPQPAARRSQPLARGPQPAAKPRPQTADAQVAPKRLSATYRRRRAVVTILGLGALITVGGVLAIIGIGRATSSGGIILVGLGSFLMILSVTLPAFKIVDAAIRAIGRLLRNPPTPGSGSHRSGRRS